MTIVVEASVAAKWFVEEAGREQALKVLDASDRHAPDLIVAEVGNVAWKKAVRGEVTGGQARFICASVRRYFATLHRSERLVERAIDLTLRLRHPIYDCLYLACAERTGAHGRPAAARRDRRHRARFARHSSRGFRGGVMLEVHRGARRVSSRPGAQRTLRPPFSESSLEPGPGCRNPPSI